MNNRFAIRIWIGALKPHDLLKPDDPLEQLIFRSCGPATTAHLPASDGADRPAVDDELGAVNGGRPVGGQVSDKVGDLFRFGSAAD